MQGTHDDTYQNQDGGRLTLRSYEAQTAIIPPSADLQVASVQYELEQPIIWRRDLLATITVQADVVPGIEAKTVNTQLASALAEFAKKLPPGYKIEAGGTVEESAKGLRSIAVIFPMMIFLTLTILMVQLQSFQKMFLVISVAPLGLMIGIVAALLPTGTPMGFVAILGIIALSGMIIRNSEILIDQIDMDMARGLHPWDAVIDATTNRFRPLVLTAAAASLGMIPIALEVFWGRWPTRSSAACLSQPC